MNVLRFSAARVPVRLNHVRAINTAGSVCDEAVQMIRSRAPDAKPRIGIILGSGMGSVADDIKNPTVIPYGDLPGFHVSTVQGHAGSLVLGQLGDVEVACLQGRVHLYEGGNPEKVRCPVYTLKGIGCDVLLMTTAVGSLREDVGPGQLVTVTDHINFQGCHPLVGPNDPIGTRFPSLIDAYDPKLRELLHQSAQEEEVPLYDGVYLACTGPSFETPAEIRAFRTLGADVVGMSVVPEVIAARHAGLRCAAVGTVVNLASGMSSDPINHEETLYYANQASGNIKKILLSFLDKSESW